jgi:hypothetical protein
VCGALADAVRRELAQAVAYWWGALTAVYWRPGGEKKKKKPARGKGRKEKSGQQE